MVLPALVEMVLPALVERCAKGDVRKVCHCGFTRLAILKLVWVSLQLPEGLSSIRQGVSEFRVIVQDLLATSGNRGISLNPAGPTVDQDVDSLRTFDRHDIVHF